jgi:hypothetical protein
MKVISQISHSKIVMIWFLLLVAPLVVNIPLTTANANRHSEIMLTINPANPIRPDLTPNEFTFETVYLNTIYFSNSQNTDFTLNIPEQRLGDIYGNESIRNVTMYDNLNHTFEVIENGSGYFSLPETIILPAHFEYRSYLSYVSDHDIYFDANSSEYILNSNITPAPDTFIVRFPSDFTILGTIPAMAQENTDPYIILTMQPETPAISVKFLPFSHPETERSVKFTLDLPTIFPNEGQAMISFEQSFNVPKTFSIWNVTPFLYYTVNFPEYTSNVIVDKVWDGIGSCNEISQPTEKLDNSSMGNYYADYAGKRVIIYPRYGYSGDFYQYSIGVRFATPSGYKPFNMKAALNVPPFPYTFRSVFGFDKSPAPGWSTNLTGNVEMEFILPSGADISYNENSNFTVGVEGGRPTAVFVYNAPETMLPTQWSVTYDLIPLRNYFWLVVISIFLLIAVIAIMVILKLPANSLQSGLELLGVSGLMIWNIQDFLSLGGFENTLTGLFIVSIILWFMSIVISAWKTHARSEENNRETRDGHKIKPKPTRKKKVADSSS